MAYSEPSLNRAGVIQPRTVIKSLGGIFSLDTIRRSARQLASRRKSRRGYEQLFECGFPGAHFRRGIRGKRSGLYRTVLQPREVSFQSRLAEA